MALALATLLTCAGGGCSNLGSNDSPKVNVSGTHLPQKGKFPIEWQNSDPYIADVNKTIKDRKIAVRLDWSLGYLSVFIKNVGGKPITVNKVETYLMWDHDDLMILTGANFLRDAIDKEHPRMILKPGEEEDSVLITPGWSGKTGERPNQLAVRIHREDGEDTYALFLGLQRMIERDLSMLDEKAGTDVAMLDSSSSPILGGPWTLNGAREVLDNIQENSPQKIKKAVRLIGVFAKEDNDIKRLQHVFFINNIELKREAAIALGAILKGKGLSQGLIMRTSFMHSEEGARIMQAHEERQELLKSVRKTLWRELYFKEIDLHERYKETLETAIKLIFGRIDSIPMPGDLFDDEYYATKEVFEKGRDQSSSPITPQEAEAAIKGKLAPERHHLINDTHVQLAMAYEGNFDVVYHAGPPERIEITPAKAVSLSISPVTPEDDQEDLMKWARLPGVDIVRGGKKGIGSSDEEVIAVVSEDGKTTVGSEKKNIVHEQGLWHMTSHIYVFDQQGRILLQKRSSTKKSSPNKFQVTVSGHVNMGETPRESAFREAWEEIGINVDSGRLAEVSGLNAIKRSYASEEGQNNEFTTVLKYVVSDQELAQIQQEYNLNEIAELWLLPQKTFEEMINQDPDLFSRSLKSIIKDTPDIYQKIKPSSSPTVDSGQKLASDEIRDTNDELGGIDMNTIDLGRQGAGVDIQFDPAQLQELIDLGIDGFAPVIINIVPLPSVLPLLGLEPIKEEEGAELSKVN